MLGPTARAFGAPMPCTYGGREIVVCGRVQENYAQIETEFLRRHPDPMQLYRDKVDSGMFPNVEERAQFMKFCVEQACQLQDAMPQDILNWLGTRAGTVFLGSLTAKWPPTNGQKVDDLPHLTVEEMDELFAAQIAETIRVRIEDADNMQRLVQEAESAAVMAYHRMVDAASGTDLVGKETGPTSTTESGVETAAG